MNEVQLYPISDLQTMAAAIAKSGLFGMKTPEQALALMLVAQSENTHPATITQDYDIIQGKACRKTHSVLARFQAMGGRVQWKTLTDDKAEATFSHASGGELTICWTLDQAKKAGLTGKDNWKNYPRAMLRARCIAEGVRAVYPAAIGGMMVSEEAQDSQPAFKGAESQATSETVSADQAAFLRQELEATNSNVSAFLGLMKVSEIEQMTVADFDRAVVMLANKRKKMEAANATGNA